MTYTLWGITKRLGVGVLCFLGAHYVGGAIKETFIDAPALEERIDAEHLRLQVYTPQRTEPDLERTLREAVYEP